MSAPDVTDSPEAMPALGAVSLLERARVDFQTIIYQLGQVAEYMDGENGNGRIAHEAREAARILGGTMELIDTYQSGKPLPTLAEIRGIFARSNDQALPQPPKATVERKGKHE